MAIMTFHGDLFHLCIIEVDTASEAIPIMIVITYSSITLLLLVVWFNFGKK